MIKPLKKIKDKTTIGTIGFCLAGLGAYLIGQEFPDHEGAMTLFTALKWVFGALGGAGLIHKYEKWTGQE